MSKRRPEPEPTPTPAVADPNRARFKLRLIEHQSERLKETYRDFAEQERYARVTDFFFNGIYSTKDKTQRDADFKSLYQYFQNKLGMEVIRALGRLVELNDLTDRLDEVVVDKLMQACRAPKFTHRQYEQAYRDGDNRAERLQQIKLIVDSVAYFHEVSHWRSIGLMLKVIHLTARLKGAHELGSFIENGFQAFRSLDDIQGFTKAVADRELERLERIWREYEPSASAARGR